MSRMLLIGAALLSLVSNALACSCFFPGTTLRDCPVGDGQVALLVTIKCVKSLQCESFTGTAIADALIEEVFLDNTDSNLTLAVGETVTIKSELESSLCGFGRSFFPGSQLIVFAAVPSPPFSLADLPVGDELELVSSGPFPADPDDYPSDEDDVDVPSRRLMQRVGATITASANENSSTISVGLRGDVVDLDGVFSDGSICDVADADLSTGLCNFNIVQPSLQNITDLMAGCSGDSPAMAPSMESS